MAEHTNNNLASVEALTSPDQGRELSCTQLVFWSMAMALACLLVYSSTGF